MHHLGWLHGAAAMMCSCHARPLLPLVSSLPPAPTPALHTPQVTASQKRLQNKYELAQSTADDWYRRAELALGKGDEELAKEALSRRKAFQVCMAGCALCVRLSHKVWLCGYLCMSAATTRGLQGARSVWVQLPVVPWPGWWP